MTLLYDANGLIPAIVQHAHSGEVLMLGYMNADALAQTQSSGNVTFFSRSRQQLWVKGETSGHFLRFVEARRDCDSDALLILAMTSAGVPLGAYRPCQIETSKPFRPTSCIVGKSFSAAVVRRLDVVTA